MYYFPERRSCASTRVHAAMPDVQHCNTADTAVYLCATHIELNHVSKNLAFVAGVKEAQAYGRLAFALSSHSRFAQQCRRDSSTSCVPTKILRGTE